MGTNESMAPVIPKYACSRAEMNIPQIAIQAAAFRRPMDVRRKASQTTGDTATATRMRR
jgi:hypothetical protein